VAAASSLRLALKAAFCFSRSALVAAASSSRLALVAAFYISHSVWQGAMIDDGPITLLCVHEVPADDFIFSIDRNINTAFTPFSGEIQAMLFRLTPKITGQPLLHI
jgi:hypothetical protein